MRYVVIEGLPAAGKSEVLELLARFYPAQVRVFPELVKQLVLENDLDLFTDRASLTDALLVALPQRREDVRRALDAGFLCIEESHVGVHYAYAQALGDGTFDVSHAELTDEPLPDVFLRLDLPVSTSIERQAARGTHRFDVDEATLEAMLEALDRWHAAHGTKQLQIDADRPAHALVRSVEDALELTYGARSSTFEDAFDVLLLLGRPASGKSEFIDFMKHAPVKERARTFHIAPFDEVDDFPILWRIFEEDDVWESIGRPRLHSKRCNGNYAVADDNLWPFLIEQINRAARSFLASPDKLRHRTLLVEFSRGGPTGYRDALARLSPEILERAAALYVSVSFEESWRRNIARYDEKARDEILTHSVPREEMERTYGTDDWLTLTDGGCGRLDVGGISVPYATLPNEPESVDPVVLAERYRTALDALHALWRTQGA